VIGTERGDCLYNTSHVQYCFNNMLFCETKMEADDDRFILELVCLFSIMFRAIRLASLKNLFSDY